MWRLVIYSCLIMTVRTLEAQALEYSGGSGRAEDPYQIATAQDLNELGDTHGDYNKHFILTSDIDLNPDLPNGRIYDRAVIAPDTNDVESLVWFHGTRFSGCFDGQGHEIRHLCVQGTDYLGLFGSITIEAKIVNLGLRDVRINGTSSFVGGLVAENYGEIANCYSTGMVSGTHWSLGGLVACNNGSITSCYSTGTVSGKGLIGGLAGSNNGGRVITSYSTCTLNGIDLVRPVFCAGGLIGDNLKGSIISCYSTGEIVGTTRVGGLVGDNREGHIIFSFWDMETSGASKSDGGAGLTTADMKDINTYLDADWDIANELQLEKDSIWYMLDQAYPHLAWELLRLPVTDRIISASPQDT
jgi:hypothetical protein